MIQQNVLFANYDFENELNLICLNVKHEFISLENQSVQIAGLRGEIFQGSKTKARKIEVEFLNTNKTEEEHLEQLKDLNSFFRQVIESNSLYQLNFSKQASIFYDVYISDISTPAFLNGTFDSTFTITFIAPSGTGYSETVEDVVDSVIYQTEIQGNVKTNPIFRGTVKQDNISNVSIMNKNNYISLGESLDSGITPSSKRIRKLYDTCTIPANWNQLRLYNDYNLEGEYLNNIETNGYSLSVLTSTGFVKPVDLNSWHGGGVSKVIDAPIENYKIQTLLRFKNTYARAKGQLGVYLMKSDLTKHLKVEISDEDNGKRASLKVILFNEATGKSKVIYDGKTTLDKVDGEITSKELTYKKTIYTPKTVQNLNGRLVKVNVLKAPYWDSLTTDSGSIRGYERKGVLLTVKEQMTASNGVQMYKLKSNTFIKVSDVILTDSKSVSTTTTNTSTTTSGKLTVQEDSSTNAFTDFYGWVSVTKTNNRYEILIEKVSEQTGLRTGINYHTIFYDSFDEFSDNVQVQSVIFTSMKKQIEEDANNVFYGDVWSAMAEIHLNEFIDANEEQVLLMTGDEIVIDCEKNKIYKNGQLFLENLALGSSFFEILGDEEFSFSNSFEEIEWNIFYKPKFN